MNTTNVPFNDTSLFVVQRNDEFIIINPDTFTWVRTSSVGRDIVFHLANGVTEQNIAKYTKESVQDIRDFRTYLENEGILSPQKELVPWCPSDDHPIGCAVLLTNRCNLACKHCFYASGPMPLEDEVKTEVFLQMISQLAKNGVHYVTFTGGEPLLRRDIRTLISFARQSGLDVALLTNGLLITPENAAFLSSMKVEVQVSLDGANELTYNKIRGSGFYKVLKGLKYLVDSGCKVSVSIVPMKENMNEIPEIIELAASIGVNNFNFSLLEHSGRAEQEYHDLRPSDNDLFLLFTKLYRTYYYKGSRKSIRLAPLESMLLKLQNPALRFACKAGREVIAVDWKGNLYPCSGLVSEDHKIGSLLESELHGLYHSEKMNSIRLQMDVRSIEGCNTCPFVLPCLGGCRSKAYVFDSHLNTPDPYCGYLKEMWNYLLWEISDLQIESGLDGLSPSN